MSNFEQRRPAGTSYVRPAAGGAQDIFQPRSNKVPLPLIERAQGIFQWDEYGNEYIDVSSGPVVSNIGHGNAHVAEAMARQARTMDFAYARVARHRPNIELTARIAALAGPGFERVCLSSGGSEAIEIAIKFLRAYAVAFGEPSRTKVITCQPSYHGGTIAGLGLSGDDALKPFLDGFSWTAERVPAPLSYRPPANHTAESWSRACASALDDKIRRVGAAKRARLHDRAGRRARHRLQRADAGVFSPGARDLQAERDQAGVRRGAVRDRAHRPVPGRAQLARCAARHRRDGEGPRLGLHAARRHAAAGGDGRRARRADRLRLLAYLCGEPDQLRHRDGRARRIRAVRSDQECPRDRGLPEGRRS